MIVEERFAEESITRSVPFALARRPGRSPSRCGFDFQIHALRVTRWFIGHLSATKLRTKFVHRNEKLSLNH